VEPLDPRVYRDLVRRALEEDVGDGDVTTEAIVPAHLQARGTFSSRARASSPGSRWRSRSSGSSRRGPWDRLPFGCATANGAGLAPRSPTSSRPARTLLVGERTALNYLQRLSGIATLTRRFGEAANGRITILDTRKTTPTLRALEKYAVRVGGGANHRSGLFDAILIKDNHIALAGGVKAAIDRARGPPARACRSKSKRRRCTTWTLALAEGVEVILLDNMSTADIRIAVARATGRAKTEISGGVTSSGCRNSPRPEQTSCPSAR
jgi:nicotinate-nucleotide pyrophosphorylase (carboxylating)